jgi:hypothetical protein
LADTASAADEPVEEGPQGRSLSLDAAAAVAEPEPPAAAAEPEPESEPESEPEPPAARGNEAALESALESEAVGLQLPRNTRYEELVTICPAQVEELVTTWPGQVRRVDHHLPRTGTRSWSPPALDRYEELVTTCPRQVRGVDHHLPRTGGVGNHLSRTGTRS